MRFLQRVYRPAFPGRWIIVPSHSASRLSFSSARLVLASGIGSEFMPPLNEGDIMFMPIADASISLAQNTAYAKRQDKVLESFPEVAYVAAKIAPCGDFDRSGRFEHDGDHRASQTARSVATGHDPCEAQKRHGPCRFLAWRGKYLDATDHQSNRHAHDGYSIGDWRQALWV